MLKFFKIDTIVDEIETNLLGLYVLNNIPGVRSSKCRGHI